MTRPDRAARFRHLHLRGDDAGPAAILVLPNAWDAMSARLVEEAGARAIATTSAAVSWALGRPDGEGISRDAMLEVVRRVVEAVRLPVTADIEGGYGTGSPDDVAGTVRGVLAAGAVGINLEDGATHGEPGLLPVAQQVERITAARAAAQEAGADLFINARVDTYLVDTYLRAGAGEGRLEETVRRAHAYMAAGADGIFVPGVTDAPTIRRLAGAVAVPLNVMAGPGAPAVTELRALGVARVSVGPALALSAMVHIRRAAGELLQRGTYGAFGDVMPFAEADALFTRGHREVRAVHA